MTYDFLCEIKKKFGDVVVPSWQSDTLCHTIFYFVGSRFGLHGGKEHHSLVRFPQSRITIQQKPDGSDYLVYHEFVSKTTKVVSVHMARKAKFCMLSVQGSDLDVS